MQTWTSGQDGKHIYWGRMTAMHAPEIPPWKHSCQVNGSQVSQSLYVHLWKLQLSLRYVWNRLCSVWFMQKFNIIWPAGGEDVQIDCDKEVKKTNVWEQQQWRINKELKELFILKEFLFWKKIWTLVNEEGQIIFWSWLACALN